MLQKLPYFRSFLVALFGVMITFNWTIRNSPAKTEIRLYSALGLVTIIGVCIGMSIGVSFHRHLFEFLNFQKYLRRQKATFV